MRSGFRLGSAWNRPVLALNLAVCVTGRSAPARAADGSSQAKSGSIGGRPPSSPLSRDGAAAGKSFATLGTLVASPGSLVD
jgi:hypothetical protein